MVESASARGSRGAERLRLPPHSLEAERSLLGGLMLDQRAWDFVADAVDAADFYRADHRLIFEAIATLVERDQPPDAVTVGETLARQGELEAAGGLDYLARLVEETASAANIRAYARIVRERAMLRQLIQIGGDIAASALEEEGRTVDELVDLAEQRVFEIADRGQRKGAGFVSLKQILPQTIDRLDVLSHAEGDITGVSTGFNEMDRMTAGFQRGDLIVVAGRPSMGKCIVSGSRILDPATGRLEPIEVRVRERRSDLVSLDGAGRLRAAKASAFVDDGVKPVYEVRTALGRRIAVTASHPFLTVNGWRRLDELEVGAHVGVPRVLPYFGRKPLPEALVKLIAYFLTDGGATDSVPKFTSPNARIRADFHAAVGRFPGMGLRIDTRGETPTPTVSAVPELRDLPDLEAIRSARPTLRVRLRDFLRVRGLRVRALAHLLGTSPAGFHCWATGAAAPSAPLSVGLGALGLDVPARRSAGLRKNGDNPLVVWLRSLGLWGASAHEKRVPEAVFELPRPQLALFLNRAFACYGSISVQNGDLVAVSFSSVSERLARDMQHLLLRFGIVAKLRRRRDAYEDTSRTAYELRILLQEDIARFVLEIGVALEASATEASAPEASAPEASAPEATALEASAGIIPDDDDDELRNPATGDVYWDRIETIRYLGLQQVYDLTVPEHHNFVADDVIVHNTTLAMNVAESAAIGAQVPVAIFSMEMSAEQLSFRMIGSIGRVNQSHLRTGRLTEEDWSRIDSAVSMMSNAPIFIDDSPALTPTEVRARARRLKREHGLGLIVVDYLQLMQVAGTVENRATEISEISRSLKALAKELAVPVVALSQLNRSVEQRADKKPVMSDLRESGAIEQDADLIVFIYREEVYEPDTPRKGIADIIIGKQRNGPVGEFRLTFLGEFTKFENLVAEAYSEGVF